jgi:hypothetical protein
MNSDDKTTVNGLITDLEYFTAWLADEILERDTPIYWETMKELRDAVEKVGFVLECITEQAEDLV